LFTKEIQKRPFGRIAGNKALTQQQTTSGSYFIRIERERARERAREKKKFIIRFKIIFYSAIIYIYL